jgi:hypothetical protein
MRVLPLPVLLGVLVFGAAPALAQSDDCPYRRELPAARVDMPAGTPLRLNAEAGSLVVRGVQGLREVRIRGTVCATSAELGQRAHINAERTGGAAVVETVIPDTDDSFGDAHVRIDLVVEVPLGTAATVNDGSGSAELSGLGDLEVHDGSGSLQIEDINGSIEIHDGSGSVEIRGARGRIEVHDGSGDVVVHDVDGDVVVYDGSGSIEVDGARSLVVAEDGSGSVDFANVRGRVDVPRRGRRP